MDTAATQSSDHDAHRERSIYSDTTDVYTATDSSQGSYRKRRRLSDDTPSPPLTSLICSAQDCKSSCCQSQESESHARVLVEDSDCETEIPETPEWMLEIDGTTCTEELVSSIKSTSSDDTDTQPYTQDDSGTTNTSDQSGNRENSKKETTHNDKIQCHCGCYNKELGYAYKCRHCDRVFCQACPSDCMFYSPPSSHDESVTQHTHTPITPWSNT